MKRARGPPPPSNPHLTHPLASGMTPLLWVVLWSALPALALLSGPDQCGIEDSSSSHRVSSLLESLQCYNDYVSYVHCKWREHRNMTLQLWFKTEDGRKLCEPYSPQGQDENGTSQCKHKAEAFAIGIRHIAFFLKNETLTVCSSAPRKPLHLSKHLRARPPVNLTTDDAGDGGRLLRWHSPYPSSSSLNLTYQLSYKPIKHDNWTTEDVTNTSMKLEKNLLLTGHRYEARVRAQAHIGDWSNWSPAVIWNTEEDAEKIPSLHCVLDGEKEVNCGWEVREELTALITYKLVCRHNQNVLVEGCCVNLTVSPVPSGRSLRYSCSVTVAEPAHLVLELQPTHISKTFDAYKHIRPNPPQEVNVREEKSNWIVSWIDENNRDKLTLDYEVCYYMAQEQECSNWLRISGAKSVTLLGASLFPSQQYQVKVRSLVKPGEGQTYEGIPSEWSDPVEWTSHTATWSLTTLMYVLSSVFMATVFFTLYCTIPTCQRRVILWVGSVPSPGKSKIVSDIKSATSWTLMPSEDTSICKVLHFNPASTCSSGASLWLATGTDTNKSLESGYWHIDNLPTTAEKTNGSDTSSMSFTGPYIFCQTSEKSCKSADVKCEEKDKEEKTLPDDSPPPMNFALFGGGYVCLPSRTVSRSTQDLVPYSDASTNTCRHDGTEQGQPCPDTTLGTDVQMGLSADMGADQPPAYTSTPFMPWPQGGAIHPSGNCHFSQPQ